MMEKVVQLGIWGRGGNWYIGLFWSWTTPSGHALGGIRDFQELWAHPALFWPKRGALSSHLSTPSVFSGQKGVLFPVNSVNSEGSSIGKDATENKKKNTFCRFQNVNAKRGQSFTDCTSFGHVGAIFFNMATVTPLRQPAPAHFEIKLIDSSISLKSSGTPSIT